MQLHPILTRHPWNHRFGLPADLSNERSFDFLEIPWSPEPVFQTRQTVKEMNINEILEVLADDPVAEEDIKSWVKKSENELISFNKDDKLLKFLIRKVK